MTANPCSCWRNVIVAVVLALLASAVLVAVQQPQPEPDAPSCADLERTVAEHGRLIAVLAARLAVLDAAPVDETKPKRDAAGRLRHRGGSVPRSSTNAAAAANARWEMEWKMRQLENEIRAMEWREQVNQMRRRIGVPEIPP